MEIVFPVRKKGFHHQQFELPDRISKRQHAVQHLVQLLLCDHRPAWGKRETELFEPGLVERVADDFYPVASLTKAERQCQIGLDVARASDRANRDVHRGAKIVADGIFNWLTEPNRKLADDIDQFLFTDSIGYV
jgi:hypothetical protein